LTETVIPTHDAAGLPHALEDVEELIKRISTRLFVCLDYDGTLTPIVPNPSDANLGETTRSVIRGISSLCPVAIVSGRDLSDLRARVGLSGLYYAGSHGFEIQAPSGKQFDVEEAWGFYPLLEAAEVSLRKSLTAVPGAQVERKKFALAVHYRNVQEGFVESVRQAVDSVSRDHPGLRVSQGKMVYDFKAKIDWNKGKAVRKIQRAIDGDGPASFPLYIGDDTTDEDAFSEIQADGLGVIVRDEDPGDTSASYALDTPDEVRRFLKRLAELKGEKEEDVSK